jgi:hypothetical protein
MLYVAIPKGFLARQDTGFIFWRTPDPARRVVRRDLGGWRARGLDRYPEGPRDRYNPSESTARMFIQLKRFGERETAETVIQRV